MRFFTVSELSDSRALTPEGFLLVTNVPIARTGIQLYGKEEVPIEADGTDLVRIERDEQEVFRPETIASFEGKPVTVDHPPELVNPDNWKQYAVGNVQNVRRGDGFENDLLLADILITDSSAIDAIEDGKIEVSCGYDAEYEQIQPGRGRQINIIGNHLALVDNGRCGPRCALGDNQRREPMKVTLKEKILKAFKTRDAKALDEVLDTDWEGNGEGEERSQHIHVHVVGAGEKQSPTEGEKKRDEWGDDDPMTYGMFKKGLDEVFAQKEKAAKDAAEEEEKKKKEAEDKAKDDDKTKDDYDAELEKKEGEKEEEHEKRTTDAMKVVRSQAEIISPGFKMPTLDCKCKEKSVRDQLSAIKRQALDKALSTDEGKKLLTPLLAGKTLDSLKHAVLDTIFVAATEIMRAANNKKSEVKTTDNQKTVDAFSKGGIDKINQDFWNKRKGA